MKILDINFSNQDATAAEIYDIDIFKVHLKLLVLLICTGKKYD